ncbi:hypothetical protein [Streptomyces broussonetiae]|uniref:Uncharacterized protein n=1 Tax=Streptomyces broussonetiae TaxID=2686304 RepID=A0A6I6NGC8_9ACTN|nr:hypothetical protein [Streptomyces broussonetiae]QHA09250.1 hypothetical protein GQF42_44130 [Streptomyces broussonetiae]
MFIFWNAFRWRAPGEEVLELRPALCVGQGDEFGSLGLQEVEHGSVRVRRILVFEWTEPARGRFLDSDHHASAPPEQAHERETLVANDARSEALVFREENQGACSWDVLLKDLDRADPGVHVLLDLADRQAQRWEPWMERLSWMAVEWCWRSLCTHRNT